MTVKELIEQLEDCPQDAIVQIAEQNAEIIDVSMERINSHTALAETIVYLHRD